MAQSKSSSQILHPGCLLSWILVLMATGISGVNWSMGLGSRGGVGWAAWLPGVPGAGQSVVYTFPPPKKKEEGCAHQGTWPDGFHFSCPIQPWVFVGRTDAEAESPFLWPPDVKSRLIGKDPDAGKDWGQEEKGATEDEMVGWHYRLNGREFEQTLGDSEGQGNLACFRSWGSQRVRRLSNLTTSDHQIFREAFSMWKEAVFCQFREVQEDKVSPDRADP